LCLKELLKLNHKVESLNQDSGKPYLTDNSHRISYTHSGNYAAAIASTVFDVAIDIEARGKNRNPATRRLFMNPAENSYFEEKRDMLFFLVLWSAKESLFKIVGRKGVSLRQHISIDLENFPTKPNGKLSGIVKKDDLEKSYDIQYAIHPEFVLTYIVDSLQEVQYFSEELYGCA
jgi:phosphopantetheinyl transferase